MPLARSKLSTGEELEIGRIDAPDREWLPVLVPFLAHKGPTFVYHIVKAFTEGLGDLRTSSYVGLVGGEVITQMTVVGARGAGIVGHVYTLPEWRRRSALSQVMTAQMEDARAGGLRALTLTSSGELASRIYRSFGFQPMSPGSLNMVWLSNSDSADLFAPEQTAEGRVRPMYWEDWGAYNLACFQPVGASEPIPRSLVMGVAGEGSAEEAFPRRMFQLGDHPASWVLESGSGAVVGWFHLVSDPVRLLDLALVDVHVLPGWEAGLPKLLEATDWPKVSALYLADREEMAYRTALEAAGFEFDSKVQVAEALGLNGPQVVGIRRGAGS